MDIEGQFEEVQNPQPLKRQVGKWSLENFVIEQPLPVEIHEALAEVDLNVLYRKWRKSPYNVTPNEASAVYFLARFQQSYENTLEDFKSKGSVRTHDVEGQHSICPLVFTWDENVLIVTAKFEFKLKG